MTMIDTLLHPAWSLRPNQPIEPELLGSRLTLGLDDALHGRLGAARRRLEGRSGALHQERGGGICVVERVRDQVQRRSYT